jgi:hypothetical protein
MLHNIGEWMEHFGWVQYVSTTAWLYSGISAIHYFTLFITVGTAVLIDLRVLGLAGTRKPVSQFAQQIYPWLWGAFWLAILSGFLEFITDAGDYLPDKVFETKMTTILLAVIFTILLWRSIPKAAAGEPDRTASLSGGSKLLAALSLIFWIGSILAGVEIAAISGLG